MKCVTTNECGEVWDYKQKWWSMGLLKKQWSVGLQINVVKCKTTRLYKRDDVWDFINFKHYRKQNLV